MFQKNFPGSFFPYIPKYKGITLSGWDWILLPKTKKPRKSYNLRGLLAI